MEPLSYPWQFSGNLQYINTGYRLLVLISMKPFSFIRSIDVRSMLSWLTMNLYRANVSPCRPPETISKSLTLHPVSELFRSCFIEHHYNCDRFFGDTVHLKYLLKFIFRNVQIRASPQFFLQELFQNSEECHNLYCLD